MTPDDEAKQLRLLERIAQALESVEWKLTDPLGEPPAAVREREYRERRYREKT
jgi:hypothetical protein